MKAFLFVMYVLFLGYFLAINFFYLVLQVLSFLGSYHRIFEEMNTDFELLATSYLTIPVSIIMPAYNEELGIINSVYSAVSSDYPEFEVIIVNDGSTDKTIEVMEDEFDLEVQDIFYRQPLPTQDIQRVFRSKRFPSLWVLDKENGGKADALNAGANLAHYRYIVTSDADSIFDKEGLLRMIRIVNMDPAKIVGVGGQIRVGNGLTVEKGKVLKKRLPGGLVTNFQIIEYLGSFLGNRVGWSELNSVLVISGAFGLWRKDVMIELGGMTSETTHEDIEFTFRIHEHFRRKKIPYNIIFMPDPIVWTEVPTTWRGLFRQRGRWQRVVNEVMWIYRRMLLNPRYGVVGMAGMPYMLVFEIFGPIFEIISYIVVIVFFATGIINYQLLFLFLLVSFGLTMTVRIGGVFIEQYSFRTYSLRSLPRLFILALLENFGYHQYISIARIKALVDFLRGKKTWERIERKGL